MLDFDNPLEKAQESAPVEWEYISADLPADLQ